jgi:hypothetical protein
MMVTLRSVRRAKLLVSFSHVSLCRPAMRARLGGSQVRVCCAQLLRECCALAVALKRVAVRLLK